MPTLSLAGPRLLTCAALAVLTLTGCSDPEPVQTIEGVSPELNGTLQPDASTAPGGDVAPEAQIAPGTALAPDATLQPDTAAAD